MDDLPNAVLTKCCAFCSVRIMLFMAFFGAPSRCMLKEVMLCTILSKHDLASFEQRAAATLLCLITSHVSRLLSRALIELCPFLHPYCSLGIVLFLSAAFIISRPNFLLFILNSAFMSWIVLIFSSRTPLIFSGSPHLLSVANWWEISRIDKACF